MLLKEAIKASGISLHLGGGWSELTGNVIEIDLSLGTSQDYYTPSATVWQVLASA